MLGWLIYTGTNRWNRVRHFYKRASNDAKKKSVSIPLWSSFGTAGEIRTRVHWQPVLASPTECRQSAHYALRREPATCCQKTKTKKKSFSKLRSRTGGRIMQRCWRTTSLYLTESFLFPQIFPSKRKAAEAFLFPHSTVHFFIPVSFTVDEAPEVRKGAHSPFTSFFWMFTLGGRWIQDSMFLSFKLRPVLDKDGGLCQYSKLSSA